MIAQGFLKSKFFKNLSIPHPQNQDTSLLQSLRKWGARRKAEAIYTPHQGMIRNFGAHFEQKIGWTGWGVGSLSALSPLLE